MNHFKTGSKFRESNLNSFLEIYCKFAVDFE